MTTYEARMRLNYTEEFAEEYIKRILAQGSAAAHAVAERCGPEAEAEITAEMADYIAYALKKYAFKKRFEKNMGDVPKG